MSIDNIWSLAHLSPRLPDAGGAPHPGSGIPGVELNNNVIKVQEFKIKSEPTVLISRATFETDRKHINLSSWRGILRQTDLFTHGGGAWSELSGIQDIATRGMGPQ